MYIPPSTLFASAFFFILGCAISYSNIATSPVVYQGAPASSGLQQAEVPAVSQVPSYSPDHRSNEAPSSSYPAKNTKPLPLLLSKGDLNISYSELLASTPSVNEAFRALRPPARSEVEVLRFLTLMNMITDAWSLSGGRGHKENLLLINYLGPYWFDFTDIIVASNCVYCGDHFYVVSRLSKTLKVPSAYVDMGLRIHPRYMKLITETQNTPDKVKRKLVEVFAQLSSSGDSGTADYITSMVLKSDLPQLVELQTLRQDYQKLNASNYALMPPDKQLEMQNLWEREVARGTVNISSSLTLAESGHRPALRWLVWLMDDSAYYLYKYANKSIRADIRQFLESKTNFEYSSEHELAKFYSDNWQSIAWDDATKVWSHQ